ncbi:CAAX protease [Frondihabitans sp. PAMC 28766]|uniref:CPBP family intramembrane glutamic endopeptidase n=1 Tax=Frondihabitans sp. PAMC 28766 TaxID=1795630 RepID=UPI00078C6914|nr:CPBP family intramembrane glutamic endopeptidase [Frondihabitans sp. PAMC 28766]AMM20283.1 CAAX protease [Frondihabitans sp. PAMC 28766]
MLAHPVAEPLPSGVSTGRIRAEILIVLGLSLGASAVYSLVQILDLLTRSTPLSNQTAQLNTSLDSRELFDFVYQVLENGFDIVPVALVAYLLWKTARPHLGRLGVDFSNVGRDALWGAGLALAIGIPGLALYFAGRAIGITVDVVPTNLAAHWWTVPVLLFSALRSGVTEEVIVVAYLFARLKDLKWGVWPILLSAALLRGTYHLYQGFGAFIGNAVMGIVFGWLYMRFGRILPLVIAHFFMDAAVFVGYPWAAAAFPQFFGATH